MNLEPWQRQILRDNLRATRDLAAALDASFRRWLDAEALRFTAWRLAT